MATGVVLDHLGVQRAVSDAVLNESGILITDIDDSLLKADASTAQIFFVAGIPNTPVPGIAGSGEIFESYSQRMFESYNERMFLS